MPLDTITVFLQSIAGQHFHLSDRNYCRTFPMKTALHFAHDNLPLINCELKPSFSAELNKVQRLPNSKRSGTLFFRSWSPEMPLASRDYLGPVTYFPFQSRATHRWQCAPRKFLLLNFTNMHTLLRQTNDIISIRNAANILCVEQNFTKTGHWSQFALLPTSHPVWREPVGENAANDRIVFCQKSVKSQPSGQCHDSLVRRRRLLARRRMKIYRSSRWSHSCARHFVSTFHVFFKETVDSFEDLSPIGNFCTFLTHQLLCWQMNKGHLRTHWGRGQDTVRCLFLVILPN